MNKNFIKIFFSLSFLFSIFTIAYSQQDHFTNKMKQRFPDIADRMIQRLPDIIALKDQGIIGEDSNGYLAFVGSSKGTQEALNIVNEENADRKKVYETIARQAESTIEAVAEARTVKLVENTSSEHYIKFHGEWVKKENLEISNDIK